MPTSPKYARGITLSIRIDRDARQLLTAMVPGHMGHGKLVSELIRKEAERRTDRPRMLAELAAQAAEAKA